MIVELNFLSGSGKSGGGAATLGGDSQGDGFAALFETSLQAEEMEKNSTQKIQNLLSGYGTLHTNTNTDTDAAGEINTNGTGELENGQSVIMQEILNLLGLNEEQIKRLAALFSVSVEELGQVEVVKNLKNGATAEFSLLLPDGSAAGTARNSAMFPGLMENGELLKKQDAIAKIANLLGLDTKKAADLVEKLRIFSFEVTSENKPPEAAVQSAKPNTVAPSAAGSIEQKPQTSAENQDSNFLKTILNNAIKNGPAEPAVQTLQTQPVGIERINNTQPALSQNHVAETSVSRHAGAVMERILEKTNVLSFPAKTQVRISLSPPSLGQVDIKISLHDTGARALIVVDSPIVKQIVEQNIHQFRASLDQQGIVVGEINVNVSHENANGFKENSAQFEKPQSKGEGSDHGAGTKDENQEADTVLNEQVRKETHNSVLDITV
ncbi:MAG: hypothetical protein IEMM0002_0082 [bacterium]|nr:MAG: hypothetical protein IEMM0002_0082 [bacterium]